MSYLEREGFVQSNERIAIDHPIMALQETARGPRIPSLRFTLAAAVVSVASACVLAVGLLAFSG